MTINVRLIIGSNGTSLTMWMLWLALWSKRISSWINASLGITILRQILHIKPQPLQVSLLLYFSSLFCYLPLKCSNVFNSWN
ncbi:hypothetical protein YC2023_049148 [Brassica napus]